jgi:hypothetical protein
MPPPLLLTSNRSERGFCSSPVFPIQKIKSNMWVQCLPRFLLTSNRSEGGFCFASCLPLQKDQEECVSISPAHLILTFSLER